MSALHITAARSMSPHLHAASVARALCKLALPAAIGAELAVLVAFTPDTLQRGWHGPTGDFHNLYIRGRDLQLMGMYSPVLTPMLYPLHWLGELNAYRAVFAANVLSLCAIAFIAQRYVAMLEAKIALALAVVSLPQMHWALRIGHLTPLLGLCALCGLIALERAPRFAAVLLSLLSIKPQYAVAPFLLLLRHRRSLAATMLASAALMACIGFATIGIGAVREFFSLYLQWGWNSADKLLPVQESWMYSWPGVQISLGFEPNPIVTFDLMLLSLAIVALAWMRTDARTGACVTAFAMLLFTPYSQFYDFGLVAVGIALLPRCRIAPVLSGALIAGLWIAAVATQANTIYPTKDLLGPAQTGGVYWLTPAVLVAVGAIAVAGSRRKAEEAG